MCLYYFIALTWRLAISDRPARFHTMLAGGLASASHRKTSESLPSSISICGAPRTRIVGASAYEKRKEKKKMQKTNLRLFEIHMQIFGCDFHWSGKKRKKFTASYRQWWRILTPDVQFHLNWNWFGCIRFMNGNTFYRFAVTFTRGWNLYSRWCRPRSIVTRFALIHLWMKRLQLLITCRPIECGVVFVEK